MFRDKSLTLRLTYLGALPFWLTIIALFLGMPAETGLRIFLSYGAVIAAFMAGTVWTSAHWSESRSVLLLAMSNVIALVVFAGLAVPLSPAVALGVQASAFVALLGLDLAIYRAGDEPEWYFVMRMRITAIVVGAYAVIGLAPGVL